MKGLILLNRSYGQQIAAEMILRNYYGRVSANVEVKDINGVTSGDLTTYIGTLPADTYDKIHIIATVNEAGATGGVSFDQLAALFPKLKVDVRAEAKFFDPVSAASNATATTIILTGTVSSANDFYNNSIAVIDVGGTGSSFLYRNVKDYVGSTKTLTVNTTTTAVTTTDKVAIYDLAAAGLYFNPAAATAAYDTFHAMYPDTTTPVVVEQLRAGAGSIVLTATANSVANTGGVATLTDTGNFTANAYDGLEYFVGIRSATLGAGQIRKIISNTADVLTTDSPWDVVPTGTVVYEIVDLRHKCLDEYFLAFAILFFCGGVFTKQKLNMFVRLIDLSKDMNASTKYTFQDLELYERFLEIGETIMVAKGAGITA